MKSKFAGALVFATVAILASGQATAPATRPSTVGKIAPSATDVVPLDHGAAIPKLTLTAADGRACDVGAVLANKPTILIFYRGGWCPYCVRQLRGMEALADDFAAAGYQLLAISPDKPEELLKTKEKCQLTFTLLSDADASAMRAFGLAFQAAPTQFNLLEQYSGATHHALPVPAVYIANTDGTIKFVHFDPDFKVRMNPSDLLDKAKSFTK